VIIVRKIKEGKTCGRGWRMKIKEKVNTGILGAMKSKDQERLSVLRMIKAELLLKEKEGGKPLEDPAADLALLSMLKRYKKAKEEYESLGKKSEAEGYERDMRVIESFMSAPMLDEGQIREALGDFVREVEATGPKDFGRVMKGFMETHPNADGKIVSSFLKEILSAK
jgi:uncharacterized protein YqeY